MKAVQRFLKSTRKKENLRQILLRNIMVTKKSEQEKKKSIAKSLYLAGMSMEEISEKVGVSRATISKWVNQDGWKELRAAKTITRPELVNKLLKAIDNLIEQVNDSKDANAIAGLGDKLSKLSSVIEKLDKRTSVVDTIDVFMAFSKWMEYRARTDREITPDLLKIFNKYQDAYILEQLNKN